MLSLIIFFAACASQADEVGSCDGDELASLQETCLSYGGSFEGETSASDLVDCEGEGSTTGGGGECLIRGAGDCAVVCDVQPGDSA